MRSGVEDMKLVGMTLLGLLVVFQKWRW
jgi:hypothetical protein